MSFKNQEIELQNVNDVFFEILRTRKFFLYNLESLNFWKRYEYIERKTPSKNILEFLKQFFPRLDFFRDTHCSNNSH